MLKLKLQYLTTWCEELIHWKRPWCWERLKAGGKGDNRGPDGWMASLTQWTWVWASSRRWWRTGEPGVLQSMGSQRVGRNRATEQQQQQGDLTRCLSGSHLVLECMYFTILLFPPSSSVLLHWLTIGKQKAAVNVFLEEGTHEVRSAQGSQKSWQLVYRNIVNFPSLPTHTAFTIVYLPLWVQVEPIN